METWKPPRGLEPPSDLPTKLNRAQQAQPNTTVAPAHRTMRASRHLCAALALRTSSESAASVDLLALCAKWSSAPTTVGRSCLGPGSSSRLDAGGNAVATQR